MAALVAAGFLKRAEWQLEALARAVKPARNPKLEYGFSEWLRAQDGTPQGQDWQTWSAAMYLYAAACVEERRTPCLDEVRRSSDADRHEKPPV